MARFSEKQHSEIGKSSYEIYFRGNKKIEEVLIRLIDYDEHNLEEKNLGVYF